ncbi:MAG: BREX system P-loop protein BrxC [Synergistaceae bacterium]|nr:BREX system P-loop protein BrxC [Synergistaceae bacterium]
MKNREVYEKDPTSCRLVNDGVASVNDDVTKGALDVLRYELETFVCEGEYEKGMLHILETFLDNVGAAQQPAVWVSGFYGSGKSHLVKMLRALWLDTRFEDGKSARTIAAISPHIRECLAKLDERGARCGGLRAASGTLGAGASGGVRPALLRIIFKSAGLPERYPFARFVMWLRREGLQEETRKFVEDQGLDWDEELDDFYVSDGLRRALVALRPELFPSVESCAELLKNMYPNSQEISIDEMTRAIESALSAGGEFPLTLVVLDEVQQYIGDNGERSLDVQEAVEACGRNFGGRLMFIGTGQTAVTGTVNLKKLEGRFTVRIELSDSDVDAVVRRVVLAKREDAVPHIDDIMKHNIGEIARHLSDSSIRHEQGDSRFFALDYPLLPVRRRFWERVLRTLDRTGTDSQLRNQLSMMHRAILTNADEPLGSVLPGDYIYFDLADKLLASRILPRRVHEMTSSWRTGAPIERLMARVCGLVFLMNKLSDANPELGIRATADAAADLMTDDLPAGSARLRSELPGVLDRCVSEKILIRVGDQYRILTEESALWVDEFEGMKSALANESHRIEAERDERIRAKFGEICGRNGPSILHGTSGVSRTVHPVYDAERPSDSDGRICVWVRDGWRMDEDSMVLEARAAGDGSPTIFVFIPRRSEDELRRQLVNYKAAASTLGMRGRPNTPEGIEARGAIETAKQVADANIGELLDEAFATARVIQGGGSEVEGESLRDAILLAAANSASRLYPRFADADHDGWTKALESAQRGGSDALKLVGHEGEASRHPVCRAILSFISSGMTGADVRSNFESPPYGWPRDAVDCAMLVLLSAGAITAADAGGAVVDQRTLNRNTMGRTTFKAELVLLTAAQRIAVRKLMQMVEIQADIGDELSFVRKFLDDLLTLAASAGGDEPRPLPPSLDVLDEVSRLSGNERLLAIYEKRDEISGFIKLWRANADEINLRMRNWQIAEGLVERAHGIEGTADILLRMGGIKGERGLLSDPDRLPGVISDSSRLLRDELNRLDAMYETLHSEGMERLRTDPNWEKLGVEQRSDLLRSCGLNKTAKPQINAATPEDILKTLKECPLSSFEDRVSSLSSRFDESASGAAKLLEPKAREIRLTKGTFKTDAEIDAWADRMRDMLKTALKDGPVYLR